jgi:hypothetical protein
MSSPGRKVGSGQLTFPFNCRLQTAPIEPSSRLSLVTNKDARRLLPDILDHATVAHWPFLMVDRYQFWKHRQYFVLRYGPIVVGAFPSWVSRLRLLLQIRRSRSAFGANAKALSISAIPSRRRSSGIPSQNGRHSVIARPHCAMAHDGSVVATDVDSFRASSYQNE